MLEIKYIQNLLNRIFILSINIMKIYKEWVKDKLSLNYELTYRNNKV